MREAGAQPPPSSACEPVCAPEMERGRTVDHALLVLVALVAAVGAHLSRERDAESVDEADGQSWLGSSPLRWLELRATWRGARACTHVVDHLAAARVAAVVGAEHALRCAGAERGCAKVAKEGAGGWTRDPAARGGERSGWTRGWQGLESLELSPVAAAADVETEWRERRGSGPSDQEAQRAIPLARISLPAAAGPGTLTSDARELSQWPVAEQAPVTSHSVPSGFAKPSHSLSPEESPSRCRARSSSSLGLHGAGPSIDCLALFYEHGCSVPPSQSAAGARTELRGSCDGLMRARAVGQAYSSFKGVYLCST